MTRGISAILAATLTLSSICPVFAAGHLEMRDSDNVRHGYGAFMGAYLRIPFGQQRDDTPRAGLHLAMTHDTQSRDGNAGLQRQYLNTLEYSFTDLSSLETLTAPKLLVAGQSLEQYEEKLALSGKNTLYIVGGVVLVVGVLALAVASSSNTGDSNWCAETYGDC